MASESKNAALAGEAVASPVKPTGKVVLVSIDGWGVRTDGKVEGDAVAAAKTPVMDKLQAEELCVLADASGESVGLPEGVMGNSEVGHLTMGAGKVQFQDLVRINKCMREHAFGEQPAFKEALAKGKAAGRLHLLGLVSNGGVHSHINHLKEMLLTAREAGVKDVFVHFFADGRDTAPTSGAGFVQEMLDFFAKEKVGRLATITGRYFAMDRDKRWERIALAYRGLVEGGGKDVTVVKGGAAGAVAAVRAGYEAGTTDEFIKPLVVDAEGTVRDNDVLVFIDFRADRMRQIAETFGMGAPFGADKNEGKEVVVRKNLHVVQMTEYNAEFPMPVIFPAETMVDGVAEWLSKHGVPQFHTAESEKYAHVTFFFNGGREIQLKGEERKLVPSPNVATYDLAPEMSVADVGRSVVAAVESGKFPFVMCNLAPPDMVGHTGVYDATVKAVAATDVVIGSIWEACQKHGFQLVVTSDHGNCEEMLTAEGKPKTSHTVFPVPLIVAGAKKLGRELGRKEGVGLADVAPTVLDLMGVPPPKSMSGKTVLKQKK